MNRDPAARRRPWTLGGGRIAADRPLPWLLASLVFIVNAILSASRADWWLAALEVGTGALAALSAAAVASKHREDPHP